MVTTGTMAMTMGSRFTLVYIGLHWMVMLVMITENHGNNGYNGNDDGISIYIGLHWFTLDGDAGDDN